MSVAPDLSGLPFSECSPGARDFFLSPWHYNRRSVWCPIPGAGLCGGIGLQPLAIGLVTGHTPRSMQHGQRPLGLLVHAHRGVHRLYTGSHTASPSGVPHPLEPRGCAASVSCVSSLVCFSGIRFPAGA